MDLFGGSGGMHVLTSFTCFGPSWVRMYVIVCVPSLWGHVESSLLGLLVRCFWRGAVASARPAQAASWPGSKHTCSLSNWKATFLVGHSLCCSGKTIEQRWSAGDNLRRTSYLVIGSKQSDHLTSTRNGANFYEPWIPWWVYRQVFFKHPKP